MNWRNHITKPIKLVIWELDDTVWAGTLSEEKVKIYSYVKKILIELKKRGINNAICSKNKKPDAVKKLKDFQLWEYFNVSSIDYTPKGARVAMILNSLNISAENALVIDHDAFDLLEIQFYNRRINLLHASFMENILKNPLLQGDTMASIHLNQIENIMSYCEDFRSNEEFLKSIHIRIAMIDCKSEYLDQIVEFVNGANKLNYTKKQMSKDELIRLLSEESITVRCIQEVDDIGEKGFVGFFAIKSNNLVHFLFSSRVLGMGIEQRVYSYLHNPNLEITGEVAVPLIKDTTCNNFIEIIEERERSPHNKLLFYEWEDERKRTSIYALGACDMFNMSGNLATPCNKIICESNTYKGNFRSVNVGTEYIRSNFEMSRQEKEFCKTHFYNYSSEHAFQLKIFHEEYDYVILSSYDDLLYQIYVNRTNSNIRVLRNHEPIIGEENNILGTEESQEWLVKNFYEPVYMSETRYYENLQWIRERLSPKTMLLLLNGPEFDFYMLSNNPAERHNPEVRERIILLNKVLNQFAIDNNQNVRVINVNCILTRMVHFTNHIFHWTHQKCFEIARECAKTMVQCPSKKEKVFLNQVIINRRKIVIWGSSYYAQICYYSLIANGVDIYAVYDHRPCIDDDFAIEKAESLRGNKQKYYVLVIEHDNCKKIEELLKDYGYTDCEDYTLFPSATLLKTHTTVI